jgi:hypothetical protein
VEAISSIHNPRTRPTVVTTLSQHFQLETRVQVRGGDILCSAVIVTFAFTQFKDETKVCIWFKFDLQPKSVFCTIRFLKSLLAALL